MKKTLVGTLSLFAILGLVGCGGGTTSSSSSSAATSSSTVPASSSSAEAGYKVAVVTDVGQLMDGGFNQGTYEGAKQYAEANGLTYKYYQPANGSNATDNDRIAAYNLAIQNGAQIIVAPGFLQATAMRTVAVAHSDVKFVFVDGWALAADSANDFDSTKEHLANVTAITYKEQEAGYFAGYGAAMEGFTKLGGTFGGGGTNPACERFAYGYVQGIEAGAAAKGATDKLEVKVSFKYSSSFSASTDLATQISSWYSAGTQVVFACGGSMVNSVIAAVGNYTDRYIIGVDTDQASLSDQVITSATKGLNASVQKILGQWKGGAWDTDLKAKAQNLGAAEDATGLPTADGSWRFKTFTKEQYNALFNSVKNGTVVPDGTVATDINDATWWANATSKMTHVTVTLDK